MVFISAASIDLTKTEHVIALEDCGITAVSRGSSEGRARDGGGGQTSDKICQYARSSLFILDN